MQAMIMHDGVARAGRGFSCKELVEADLTCEQAYALKVPMDRFRKSSHKANVELLKKARANLKVEPKAAKPRGTPPASAPKKSA